jgi:hypothetical protein
MSKKRILTTDQKLGVLALALLNSEGDSTLSIKPYWTRDHLEEMAKLAPKAPRIRKSELETDYDGF